MVTTLKVVFYFAFFAFTLSHPHARSRGGEATKGQTDTIKVKSIDAPINYCGLYCVYSAAKMLGKSPEFGLLAEKEFVSTQDGSTAQELLNAIEKIGLHGSFHTNVPIAFLESAATPAILRLRPPGLESHMGHWVLYHGNNANGLLFYDPPDTSATLTQGELLSLWDGSAIFVSESPKFSWVPPGSTAIIVMALAILTLHRLGTRSKLHPALIILTPPVVLAMFLHLLLPNGFARSKAGVSIALQNSFDGELSEVSQAELQMLLENGCNLVDARLAEAYAAGHLPNAVSIPVNSTFLKLRKSSLALNPSLPVVVYCQSSKCPWASVIGRSLAANGYANVKIYKGGYDEWQSTRSDAS